MPRTASRSAPANRTATPFPAAMPMPQAPSHQTLRSQGLISTRGRHPHVTFDAHAEIEIREPSGRTPVVDRSAIKGRRVRHSLPADEATKSQPADLRVIPFAGLAHEHDGYRLPASPH